MASESKDPSAVKATQAQNVAPESATEEFLPSAIETQLQQLASQHGLDVFGEGSHTRRSSSRFCLGVEHGDYNGTELFGVGTDRFIWLSYKPNNLQRMRLASSNFPEDGLVEIPLNSIPPAGSLEHSWARFPCGVLQVLQSSGYKLECGVDAVIAGNIPGGGMSRSASLSLNLVLSFLHANGIAVGSKHEDLLKIVDLAQRVETEYIGSPSGQLDQIMILFAKEGMGTHYNPRDRSVKYIPMGDAARSMRIVSLDTGTDRPGLEKSTYRIRRAQCDELAALIAKEMPEEKAQLLGDVHDRASLDRILERFGKSHPEHCRLLTYIFHAQQRFHKLMTAWKAGACEEVGQIFRLDGHALRDDYRISGPELETMCNIARTVPGVLGERMLGGGDKGAAGALVLDAAVDTLTATVNRAYPLCYPSLADKFAVHVCKAVDGIVLGAGLKRK